MSLKLKSFIYFSKNKHHKNNKPGHGWDLVAVEIAWDTWETTGEPVGWGTTGSGRGTTGSCRFWYRATNVNFVIFKRSYWKCWFCYTAISINFVLNKYFEKRKVMYWRINL